MIRVKVYGAGSIGNHLSYACRNKGWDVTICDIDPDALDRTKNEIYPSRYGCWDENIKLMSSNSTDTIHHDVVIIGTPPNSHASIALEVLSQNAPKVLLIEKPMFTPDLKNAIEVYNLAKEKGTIVLVGYNHVLTKNSIIAEEYLKNDIIGKPITITSMTREHWGGIFSAHPWLNGPEDTYLGYYTKGGGACLEHSHAINIWQHFAHLMNLGRITNVSASLNIIKEGKAEYDDMCFVNVKTDKGFIGNVIQDVVTSPTQKNLRVQGSNGFMEWHVGYKDGNDAIIYGNSNERKEILIPKSRPDDFKGEIDHVEYLLNGGDSKCSPISIERGLDTMMVIAAVFLSHKEKREVTIDYSKGYTLNAIK